MTNPNVFFEETGVTHARSPSGDAITRCGIAYDRLKSLLNDFISRPPGVETESPVDCMTCLVKSASRDIREIITDNSVKDIQEGIDARYLDAIEWEKLRRGS
jgi:hypothetical protein